MHVSKTNQRLFRLLIIASITLWTLALLHSVQFRCKPDHSTTCSQCLQPVASSAGVVVVANESTSPIAMTKARANDTHLFRLANENLVLRMQVKSLLHANQVWKAKFKTMSSSPHDTQHVTLDPTVISAQLSDTTNNGTCETVHVAFVVCGYNSTRHLVTLVKSIVFHRKSLLHFHLLVNEVSQPILVRLFDTWRIASLQVSFYRIERYEHQISWIPSTHYSRKFALMKLTLPSVLPSNLSRVIVLDTDTTVLSDIGQLWHLFRSMSTTSTTDRVSESESNDTSLLKQPLIGLVENQSNWYLARRRLTPPAPLSYNPWPAVGRGFNTGVILLDLGGLRAIDWFSLWRQITETQLASLLSTSLADQDIFNALIRAHPAIVYKLPCQWNVQLSDHTLIEQLCNSELDIVNLIHWNSPNKPTPQSSSTPRLSVDSNNKHLEYFQHLYSQFAEFDGNLLQREHVLCHDHTTIASIIMASRERPTNKNNHSTTINSDDECAEFQLASSSIYRTHLFYLQYNYTSNNPFDITLVIQLSMDRIQLLEQLCQYWNGPISAALFLTDAEVQKFMRFVSESLILQYRKNIGYHIVYREGLIYPINKLRNIALEQCTTPFVFLSDVDFIPGPGLYESLQHSIKSLKVTSSMSVDRDAVVESSNNQADSDSDSIDSQKDLLVVPAFEFMRYKSDMPATKADLVTQLNLGSISTFRAQMWPQGHAATDYERWKTSTLPYRVEWQAEFEPYFVAPTNIAKYDERFVGFGWNKVSHAMLLAARGYKFIVLPNAFIVHNSHAPSFDILRHRSIPNYRRCIRLLKESFLAEMRQNSTAFFQHQHQTRQYN